MCLCATTSSWSLARLCAHASLPIVIVLQLVSQTTDLSFGDLHRFLRFGEGGCEAVDFVFHGCGGRWVAVHWSGF